MVSSSHAYPGVKELAVDGVRLLMVHWGLHSG